MSTRILKDAAQQELFIGLVGAVGTELDRLTTLLTQLLASVGYSSSPIRLSSLLRALPKNAGMPTEKDYADEYIDAHMTAGDEFRKLTGRNDAVALLGVGRIKDTRSEAGKNIGEIIPRRAYILRSLKNPEEVHSLRDIYGSSFYLIAAYSPANDRRTYLAKRIAHSRNEYPYDRHYPTADRLILRDQEEVGTKHGQQTRDCFHRADLFVDMSDDETLRQSLQRFLELIFGNTFHTPTREESGMFHAHAAALRSAELGRQVGCSVANRDGDIIAVGCNEVPKAGGGLYWCGDKPDRREFRLRADSGDQQKRELVAETLKILKDAGWLGPAHSSMNIEELVGAALHPVNPVIPKDSKIRNIIEYGRAVHGEMAAISDAARRGVSVARCSMYVTTFPCHLCARHIVAAGIRRVFYVEPYAKSLTAELYPDSIAVDGGLRQKGQVPFLPFVGIAPRKYIDLFTKGKRKTDDGLAAVFSSENAQLRYYEEHPIYLETEVKKFKNLIDIMSAKGIIQP